MDDIVARLRKRHANEGWIDDLNVELDAADEIERMQKVHDTLVAKMAKLADERNRWRNVASYFEVAIVNDYLDGGIPPGSVWLLEALEDYKEIVSKVSDEVMRIDDDIVTRLRNHAEDEAMLGNDWLRDVMRYGADEIERLREELKSQTFWAELLSGNKCYCVPGDVGVCMPCAYRQTIRQNEEVIRG